MNRLNHVNLDGVKAFVEAVRVDPSKGHRTQKFEGRWVFTEGDPQFEATLPYEGGTLTLKADNPTFMGGEGKTLGPLHYCFFGLMSCYTGVFVVTATQMGIPLKRVETYLEADMDFHKVFGLGDAPIMKEIRITLKVESDAPRERIEEAERLAQERCPAVFTLRNPVKFTSKLELL